MKRLLRLPPSLWLAAGLVALLFAGGAASVSFQGWKSKKTLQAAAAEMTGGDARRGKIVIESVGCGACHEIPGIDRATGSVGPGLDKMATRAFVAGKLPNNPANLIAWVQHPQAIEPGSGMPDPGISDQEARDVAAYLYTLK